MERFPHKPKWRNRKTNTYRAELDWITRIIITNFCHEKHFQHSNLWERRHSHRQHSNRSGNHRNSWKRNFISVLQQKELSREITTISLVNGNNGMWCLLSPHCLPSHSISVQLKRWSRCLQRGCLVWNLGRFVLLSEKNVHVSGDGFEFTSSSTHDPTIF